MKISKKKYNRGITLVALVVTIIIILIISAISISMLSGDNSVIKKASEAKEKMEESQKKEKSILDVTEMILTGENYNKPELKNSMIPVKWNESEKTWVKADKGNNNKDWYDYSKNSKKWANAVTVKENGTENLNGSMTRTSYLNAEIGTPIKMEDITAMFVWIPRYAYKIPNEVYHQNAEGTATIEIEWLLGNSNESHNNVNIVDYNADTTDNFTKFPDGFVVHPAFTANTDMGGTGEEIKGFWVGKFESSNYQMATEYVNNEGLSESSATKLLYGQGDKENITIKPNVTSWRQITVPTIYEVCQNMSTDNNIHGLKNDATTVMMQNSQWGAVSYLVQSDYGNKQTQEENSGIWNNPYNEGFTYEVTDSSYGIESRFTTLTGMVGKSRDNNSPHYSKVKNKTKNADGSTTIKYVVINSDGQEGRTYTNTYYSYETTNGIHGSTTGNIYGIYDMSGGAWDNMANYLKEIKKGTDGYKYDYPEKFNLLSNKYVTPYLGNAKSSNTVENYDKNKHMYGDAIWETSNGANGQYSWNKDFARFPYSTSPFFMRGGYFDGSYTAGVFFFINGSGHSNKYYSFRVVVI